MNLTPKQLDALADKVAARQCEHFNNGSTSCGIECGYRGLCAELIEVESALRNAATQLRGVSWSAHRRFVAADPATRRDQLDALRGIRRVATKTLDALHDTVVIGDEQTLARALRAIVSYCAGAARRLDVLLPDHVLRNAASNRQIERKAQQNRGLDKDI